MVYIYVDTQLNTYTSTFRSRRYFVKEGVSKKIQTYKHMVLSWENILSHGKYVNSKMYYL